MRALHSFDLPAAVADPAIGIRWARRALLLLLAYYTTGRLGLATPQVGSQVSLIWPPAGIALVALLRYGPNLWPAVWLGAFFVGISTGLNVWLGAWLAIGNAAGPAIAAWLMRQHGLHFELDRRRDLWLYAGLGTGLSMVITAGNGALALALGHVVAWRDAPLAGLYWWLGDTMGAVVVGIPLLTLSRAALARALAGRAWLPTLGLAVVAVGSGWLAFSSEAGTRTLSPLIFVPPLVLCWLAARSGIFAASATALMVSIVAVLGTVQGHGPFFEADVQRSVALLSGYVCAMSAMPLLVTALIGEMAANDRRWHLALDTSQIGVGDWDLRSGRLSLSARWMSMLGHPPAGTQTDPDLFWRGLHPDDADKVRNALAPLHEASATQSQIECRMRKRDGGWAWFELHAFVAERDAFGRSVRIVSTARDIGDRHAAREQRQLSESMFRHLHEGLVITDAERRVLEANPTFCEITGHARDELLGTVPSVLGELMDTLDAHPGLPGGMWHGELSDRRRNGEPCTLQVTVSEVRGPDGALRNHVVAVTDITQARQQLDQLQRRAHFDELTRLPNRARLAQLLQSALESGEREGTLLTVCCLDLDHFKRINDRFGTDAGDRVLVELAERLRRSLRTWAGGDDVAARIGGDEFVLLLHTATLEESRHAVARLLRQASQPFTVAGTSVELSASVGATVFPFDRADAETLLRHADHAMYGAKQAGRNGYLFFDAESDRRTEARFVALGRIQEALDDGELCLHYQPKVDLSSGRALGMEALLRWNHPQEGVVAPGHFLPLIEHTALGITVGKWVLKRGLDQLDEWLGKGLDLTLSINVSARHLQEPGFANQLEHLLSRYANPVANRLVLEVLETTALADIDYTRRLMDQCRALGVRFALDDFGTGYSTFTYLKRLPLDMLKIDRSFIANMLHDPQDLAIVEGVIGLARTFGCSVVAEGVESAEQARGLLAIGCDIGQGHGIAPPMPAEAVHDWLRRHEAGPALA